jgi:tetratricopeptide (TPR) repeat protein
MADTTITNERADTSEAKDTTTNLLDELGEYIRGEITLQELTGLKPDEMMQIARIGQTMFAQGQIEKAREIYEGLTALNPHIGYYHTALGCVYLREGKVDEALKEYTIAIEKNPYDIDAYTNRGEIYLRQGRIEEALNDLNKAIELDPEKDVSRKNPVAMRALTLAMAAKENIEKMIKEEEQQTT